MPVGAISVILNGGGKSDRTFLMFAMSACETSGSADSAGLHAASAPTHAMTSTAFGFNIAANVPAGTASAA